MDQMINGLVPLFQWPAPLFLLLGVFLGMTFGILPGLGGPQVLALLIPLTFGMDEHLAVILLMGAMGAVPFGGSVTAILINTPGTGQNAATCFDGYPLTRQGKAGMALAASATASGMGALFGVVILLLLVPVARKVVLAFSYPEFFMLAVMGISMIAAVAQGS
ncbi:MAG: tripartite tricarboxylate transporter permease, partial [Bacillota bacterium]